MGNESNDVRAVIETVKALHEPKLQMLSSPTEGKAGSEAWVLAVPNGMSVLAIKKFLDEYRTAPERRKGTATVTDLQSFVDHVNRFKDGDSIIFANKDKASPSIMAVLDYHRILGEPRFGEHRTLYRFPVSDEWKAWSEVNGEAMSQADFAAFIENHLGDIAPHTSGGPNAKKFSELFHCEFAGPNKVLELSRGLTVHSGAVVTNAVNLASGEGEIRFAESHTDTQGKPLKIPGAFMLQIPVFAHGAQYVIPTRLRYRKQGPQLTWFVDIWRSDVVFEDAIKEACEFVQKGTDLPLLAGTPE